MTFLSYPKNPPDWWDYTTLDDDLIQEAARLTLRDLQELSRPRFEVVSPDTLKEFYLCEALEYIKARKQATNDNPVGICGPIGPNELLPLVARLCNELSPNPVSTALPAKANSSKTGDPMHHPRVAKKETSPKRSRCANSFARSSAST